MAQLTIYYREEDQWLIEKLELEAYRSRRSLSKVILKILEEYFGPPPEEKQGRRGRRRRAR
jgi:hypothetical protein